MSKDYKLSDNRMTAMCGMFTAVAMVLSYLESLVPVFVAVPGVKLGIANIATMIVMYKLGVKPAVIVSILRIVLSSILFGNIAMMIYSFGGALLSIITMSLLKKAKLFSTVGVSVGGALAHNMGQLIVAVFVLENVKIMYYIPVLIISGGVAGAVIGIITANLIKRIKI